MNVLDEQEKADEQVNKDIGTIGLWSREATDQEGPTKKRCIDHAERLTELKSCGQVQCSEHSSSTA